LGCLWIKLHVDRYTSSVAVLPELSDSMTCLKGNTSCPVSCTELSQIRHTTKTISQMNTTSHPGQTHSALSDAVVILMSFLFHRGLLQSYVCIHLHKEKAHSERFLFHRTTGWFVVKETSVMQFRCFIAP